MKRVIVISTLLMLVLSVGVSTSQAGSKFELGPKLGLNFMTVGGDDADNSYFLFDGGAGNRMGFTAGGFGRVYLNEYAALQFELAYVQKGAKWELEETIPDEILLVTQEMHLDYIEIPVLLSFRVPTQSTISPFFCAGGSVGFNISAKHEYDITISGTPEDAGSPEIMNAKGTQFSLIFGAGVGFDFGTNRLELSANYSMAMTDAFDDVDEIDAEEDEIYLANYSSGEAAKLKTRQISIIAQFAFGL